MTFLFWVFATLIIFHYVLFGFVVILVSFLFKKRHFTNDDCPPISFIIAAYNEEKVIAQKIQNDLQLDYPQEKLEIIVVSDGSTDSTPQIVESYSNQGVRSLFNPQRMGKIAALNRAVETAKGDLLVFSDANSMFRTNALKKLVRHFADSSIGGVCGQKTVLSNSQRKASLGDSLYWKYESALKQAESNLGSIPTADGEIFSMRRKDYVPIDPKIINDDTAITLNLISKKLRVIYDKEAITEEEASLNLKDDFNVKSRMVCGGIQILTRYSKELNPFTSFFGLQFFFHKTLRYFMWSLLLGIFITNIFLINTHPFYFFFFGFQLLFYIFSLIGWCLDKKSSVPVFLYLPYYYCNVNIAAARGLYLFLKQQSLVEIWSKAQR